MSTDVPRSNATPAELADAVEENNFALFDAMVRTLGGELERTSRLSRYHAPPGSPIFKGVFQTRLDADEADDAIDETIAWFKARQAPFFFWWAGQETKPGDLGERLVARGLVVFEKDAPAMVADIEQLDWSHPRPQELSIKPIANERELAQWKQVFVQSFGIPEWAGQAWVEATLAVGIGRTPWHLLLGTMHGEPACCGLMNCGAGVAGLLGLGTLPAYRRRGLGSAMQLERLRIARALGYRYAVLFASALGYSPYLKLGFRDTGRRISRYLWRES